MFKKIIFYAVALLLLAIGIGFAWQTYYFFSHSYEQVLNQYLLENLYIYKPAVFKKFYFTPEAYRQSLVFSGVALLLCFLLNIFYWKYRHFFEDLYQDCLALCRSNVYQMRQNFLNFSKTEKFLLFGVLASVLWHQVYMYRHTFVSMDEAFSWLFFTSQGAFVTISHYPVPNNHVFYNLCSLFWSYFVEDAILALRLTSILSFWALLLLIFHYFLKTSNFSTALFALMLVGLGFSQSIFAVQGRGYMLVALCFFVALWAWQAYLQNARKGYLLIFAQACVLGFWTIPVFLYAFLSFYAYLFFIVWWKDKQKAVFFSFLKIGVVVGGLVYLCYCPVIMYSGLSALIGNENVSPKTYDGAWFFGYILSIAMRESVIYVMSLPKYVSFAVFVLLGVILWITARKNANPNFQFLWNFLLISLPTTFAVICLMRAFPFYRVWTYYAIFLAILVAWIAFHFVFSKMKVPYIALFAMNCLLAIGAYFQFWREIQDFYDPRAYLHHKNLEQKSKEIVNQGKRVFLSVEAFYVRFWVEYAQKPALMVQDACQADVAVTEIPEPTPPCQEKDTEIWFLRFHKPKN